MPNRFTATEKWHDKWFQPLRPEFKLAWLYLVDNCDAGGFIDLNAGLADFQIGYEVDWERFLHECGDRVTKLASGKLWVVRFAEFQQKTTVLNQKNNHHVSIVRCFQKHGVNPVGHGYSIENSPRSTKGLTSPKEAPSLGPCKGKGKGKGEVETGSAAVRDFVERWNATSGVAQVRNGELSATRQRALRNRLSTPGWYGDFMSALSKFPLRCFQKPGGFKPDADWILRPDTVSKVLEGKYDWSPDGNHGASSQSSSPMPEPPPIKRLADKETAA